MEEINALFSGFAVAMTPFNLLLMLVGVTRCDHRRIAWPWWCKRNCNSVAIDIHNAANFCNHHALLYLLGRIVWRRDYIRAL